MECLSSDFEKVQVNGQRRIRNISASSDEDGYEIFIQNLPHDLYESELMPLLEQFGEVLELRLMMNFSGLTRGFAYARYLNPNSADDAVCYLNRHEIRPAFRIGVQHSLDKKKLFIGNLPEKMSEDELVSLLQTLTPNISSINVYGGGAPDNRVGLNSRERNAVVTYKAHADAASARRVLIPNRKQIFNEEVVIEWASTRKKHHTAHPTKKKITERTPFNQQSVQKSPNLTMLPQRHPIRRTYSQPGPSAVQVFPSASQMSKRQVTMFYQGQLWVQHPAWISPHYSAPVSSIPSISHPGYFIEKPYPIV